ncbi:MAG: hypothetical protein ACOX54_00580 [Christensenellales bacterium]|jgi:hypothetical protein|nr:hypothetical protein [Christensenellaceae bacterium]
MDNPQLILSLSGMSRAECAYRLHMSTSNFNLKMRQGTLSKKEINKIKNFTKEA